MLADVRWVVDEFSEHKLINPHKIYSADFSLGATIGLYSAVLDEWIAGVISVGGFTPMGLNTHGRTTEGIYGYSHLHELLPRPGFFIQGSSPKF